MTVQRFGAFFLPVNVHLLGILAQDEEREGRGLRVHPAVAAQLGTYRVDVVLHRGLIDITEHLHVSVEGEVAGTGAEGGVVV